MAPHQAQEDRKLAPDSNARVLRAAARAYDETEGVEHGTGHRRDLVGHGALLAHAYTPFARELQPEMVEHVRRIRAPNECISVLLIGNHSAGKSSFVNWYVGEPVQTTSVAMETAGITIVRRGKKRTTWRGKMTLGNFPGLDRVGQLPGVADHLTTEFCTSDKRAFRSLELIDTPGLVDGNVRYPFDVDAAMDALAEEASLIIVFLDPIGKALVGRCMAAVERLSALHHAKMHYVLSKMDTIADAHDRQSCVSQVAQELQSRVKGTHALKILQVYLPHKKGEGVGLQSKQEKTRTDPPNQLQELEDLLSVTVDTRAQEVVVKALEDCRALTQLGERILACDRASHGYNRGVKALQLLLWLVLGAVLMTIGYWLLLNVLKTDPLLVCASETGRWVHLQRVAGGKVSERLEARRSASCAFLRIYSGVPSMTLLAGLLVTLVYTIVVKVRHKALLPTEHVRKIRAMLRDVEVDKVPEAKGWRKMLQAGQLSE